MALTPTEGNLPTGTQDGPRTEDEEGVRAWHDEVRAFTQRLHDSGCRWVIPYYCSQTAYGRMDRRVGIWNIYDKWEVYQPYGLGPKPDRDPIFWMQRDQLGQLKFNYPFNTFLMRKNSDSLKRYAPCMSDRDWIEYSKGDARSIAMDGYGGMFVDNCIQHSYAPHAPAGR